MKARFTTSCLLALAVVVTPFLSNGSHAGVMVGTKLSLVIDVSGSINPTEYNLQMQGYRSAFLDSAVQSAILSQQGGVAVNAIFFSTTVSERIPFRNLTTQAEINAFANDLGALVRNPPNAGNTNIAGGMATSIAALTDDTLFESSRMIMDVSGDGFQNVGPGGATGRPALVRAQRDIAQNAGIRVNGLAIGGTSITNYYEDNVITSDGQVFEALTFNDFEAAIRSKIQREIQPGTVPEPTSLVLWSLGLVGLTLARRRRLAY